MLARILLHHMLREICAIICFIITVLSRMQTIVLLYFDRYRVQNHKIKKSPANVKPVKGKSFFNPFTSEYKKSVCLYVCVGGCTLACVCLEAARWRSEEEKEGK